jgi:hypothetical protein
MEKPPLIAEAFLFVCSVSRSSPEPFTAGKDHVFAACRRADRGVDFLTIGRTIRFPFLYHITHTTGVIGLTIRRLNGRLCALCMDDPKG